MMKTGGHTGSAGGFCSAAGHPARLELRADEERVGRGVPPGSSGAPSLAEAQPKVLFLVLNTMESIEVV